MTRPTSPEDPPEDRWSPVAEGWGRWAPTFDAATTDLDRALLDAAGVREGSSVADLACGTGEPAFGAARRVGATGSVLAVDVSPGMLRVAEVRHRAQELPWLEFAEGSAAAISARDVAHDAALCRFGVMHFEDPTAALTELRRALRPGARLACAVWGAAEEVPFLQLARDVALRHGLVPPPDPAPDEGPFRFADRDRARRLLASAGFEDVQVVEASVPMRFQSPTDYTRFLLDVSQVVRDAADRAGEELRTRFLADLAQAALDFASSDRGLCFVNAARIVHGRNP